MLTGVICKTLKYLLVFFGQEARNLSVTGWASALRHPATIGCFFDFSVGNGFLFATFDAISFEFHVYLLFGLAVNFLHRFVVGITLIKVRKV